MIQLDIEPYCENCPFFEADTENTIPIESDGDLTHYIGHTIIRCANRALCSRLVEFLKEK